MEDAEMRARWPVTQKTAELGLRLLGIVQEYYKQHEATGCKCEICAMTELALSGDFDRLDPILYMRNRGEGPAPAHGLGGTRE
jgi:hypothetical protein